MEWKKKAVRIQIVVCCAIEGFLVEETQLQETNTTQKEEIDPTPLTIYLFLFLSLCSATPCRTVGMETGWTRAWIPNPRPNSSLVFGIFGKLANFGCITRICSHAFGIINILANFFCVTL